MSSMKAMIALVKAIDTEHRTIEVVASTADIDRDGERIEPKAFAGSIASFAANPVIVATHWPRLSTGSSPLTFTMQFADTPLGQEYWSLYRDGHMRAFSVGFIPRQWEDRPDPATRQRVRTYTDVELLEVSAVPVPSNRRALARAKGWLDDEESSQQADDHLRQIVQEAVSQTLDPVLDLVENVNSLLADSNGYAERLLGGAADSDPFAGQTAERINASLTDIQSRLKGSDHGNPNCNSD